jgi:hypothetical protein
MLRFPFPGAYLMMPSEPMPPDISTIGRVVPPHSRHLHVSFTSFDEVISDFLSYGAKEVMRDGACPLVETPAGEAIWIAADNIFLSRSFYTVSASRAIPDTFFSVTYFTSGRRIVAAASR